jgi:hypothetical protein
MSEFPAVVIFARYLYPNTDLYMPLFLKTHGWSQSIHHSWKECPTKTPRNKAIKVRCLISSRKTVMKVARSSSRSRGGLKALSFFLYLTDGLAAHPFEPQR